MRNNGRSFEMAVRYILEEYPWHISHSMCCPVTHDWTTELEYAFPLEGETPERRVVRIYGRDVQRIAEDCCGEAQAFTRELSKHLEAVVLKVVEPEK